MMAKYDENRRRVQELLENFRGPSQADLDFLDQVSMPTRQDEMTVVQYLNAIISRSNAQQSILEGQDYRHSEALAAVRQMVIVNRQQAMKALLQIQRGADEP
jgi:hypothetical protein